MQRSVLHIRISVQSQIGSSQMELPTSHQVNFAAEILTLKLILISLKLGNASEKNK